MTSPAPKFRYDPASHVVVYGTLKSTGWNHHLLDRAEMVGTVELPYRLYSLGSDPHGVPGVDTLTPGHMKAEVYRINDDDHDTLPRLDWLEGHRPQYPDMSNYRRVTIDITVDGTTVPAYIYHYNHQPSAASKELYEWTPRP